jgi:dyslexia susceptibility 1 candidate gene 1 protein
MPVTGQYAWTEKADHVVVKVFLKGVSPKKVDIFCTENILKVNYAPYLVDILLFSTIDPLKHKAVVKEGVLEVKLFKKVPAIWGFLELQETSEEQAIEMRIDSLKNQEELEKQLSARRRDKRVDDERHSLRKQMALDESERSRIDNLKAEEKQRAEEEMFAVFSKINSESSMTEACSATTITRDRAPALIDKQIISEQMLNRLEFSRLNKPIIEDDDFDSEIEDDISAKKVEEDWTLVKHEDIGELDAELKYIPPPRAVTSAGGKVEINFTPRMFPTPIRESKLAEEEDWIAKNRKHLKKHAVYGKALKSGKMMY